MSGQTEATSFLQNKKIIGYRLEEPQAITASGATSRYTRKLWIELEDGSAFFLYGYVWGGDLDHSSFILQVQQAGDTCINIREMHGIGKQKSIRYPKSTGLGSDLSQMIGQTILSVRLGTYNSIFALTNSMALYYEMTWPNATLTLLDGYPSDPKAIGQAIVSHKLSQLPGA